MVSDTPGAAPEEGEELRKLQFFVRAQHVQTGGHVFLSLLCDGCRARGRATVRAAHLLPLFCANHNAATFLHEQENDDLGSIGAGSLACRYRSLKPSGCTWPNCNDTKISWPATGTEGEETVVEVLADAKHVIHGCRKKIQGCSVFNWMGYYQSELGIEQFHDLGVCHNILCETPPPPLRVHERKKPQAAGREGTDSGITAAGDPTQEGDGAQAGMVPRTRKAPTKPKKSKAQTNEDAKADPEPNDSAQPAPTETKRAKKERKRAPNDERPASAPAPEKQPAAAAVSEKKGEPSNSSTRKSGELDENPLSQKPTKREKKNTQSSKKPEVHSDPSLPQSSASGTHATEAQQLPRAESENASRKNPAKKVKAPQPATSEPEPATAQPKEKAVKKSQRASPEPTSTAVPNADAASRVPPPSKEKPRAPVDIRHLEKEVKLARASTEQAELRAQAAKFEAEAAEKRVKLIELEMQLATASASQPSAAKSASRGTTAARQPSTAVPNKAPPRTVEPSRTVQHVQENTQYRQQRPQPHDHRYAGNGAHSSFTVSSAEAPQGRNRNDPYHAHTSSAKPRQTHSGTGYYDSRYDDDDDEEDDVFVYANDRGRGGGSRTRGDWSRNANRGGRPYHYY